MLCEVLERIVMQILRRARVPLTARRISDALGGVVSADNIAAVCLKLLADGLMVKWGDDAYVPKSMTRIVPRNLLITEEYQALGMTLLRVAEKTLVHYIPQEAEHRFFEVRKSMISDKAGLGLFLRSSRALPQGAVVCEYVGRVLHRPPKNSHQGVYVVKLRTAPIYVDGVDENGDHLSLATFINDNGPAAANVEMREYDMHSGRVFVVASRDLFPGEEVLCTYGSGYWGFASYDEILRNGHGASRKRSRHGDDDPTGDEEDDFGDFVFPCRRCGEQMPRRLMPLHHRTCGDHLVYQKLLHLNCLPFNDYTAMENRSKVLPAGRVRALRRAKHFVDMGDPQTFALSHEDVVGDLTFSWSAA
ncbi:putative high mobility group (HMG) box domain-containing protein [Trypanosoma conorhini]|uniref:Putative high mobility group (HMG) box domain-containing protein n=1 Tax=Trypanosoma conorhini TaxID=83891 RepID=A0A3R7LER2_9TRYP|nr:putative high mobility group (HMG) box domain-containing protein [Trypanosoma conorhini]RNF25775.1 putative high mobility group (HMG) box domain-containing protein [Trypanosoma conorhini]